MTRDDDRAREEIVRLAYIGGYGRSGSTLIERLLGQANGCFAAGEVVHLWQRGVLDDELCSCGSRFHECEFWVEVGKAAFGGWHEIDARRIAHLQSRVDKTRWIPRMLQGEEGARFRRYKELLQALYTAIRDVSGASIVIDASKHASTAFLLSTMPGIDLRVVHLVRDARGVAYSWTKQVTRPEVVGREAYMPVYSPIGMGLRWLAYNGLFEVLKRRGVATTFVRYEGFVARPRDEMARILAHVAGDESEHDLGFFGDGSVELRSGHTVAGNPMRFRTGRLELRLDEEWRNSMPLAQRVQVSIVSAPLRWRYGYRD